MSTKYCKDCKFCKPDNSWLWLALIPVIGWIMAPVTWLQYRYRFAKCLNAPYPQKLSEEELTGAPAQEKPKFFFCSTQRSRLSTCGPEAKEFQPK